MTLSFTSLQNGGATYPERPAIRPGDWTTNTAFTLPLETEPEWYRAKNCTMLAAYWQRLHCNQ